MKRNDSRMFLRLRIYDIHIPYSFILCDYILCNITNMEYMLVTEPNGNVIMDESGNILVQQKHGKCFYLYVMQTYIFMVM